LLRPPYVIKKNNITLLKKVLLVLYFAAAVLKLLEQNMGYRTAPASDLFHKVGGTALILALILHKDSLMILRTRSKIWHTVTAKIIRQNYEIGVNVSTDCSVFQEHGC
jgi:hypothetical protein